MWIMIVTSIKYTEERLGKMNEGIKGLLRQIPSMEILL